jgi:hypothetical protein
MQKNKLALVLGVCSCAVSTGAIAYEDFSSQPVNTQQAEPLQFAGLNFRTWPNNTVEWWYNPSNQPFSTEHVVQALTLASQAWARVSNVKFVYMGTTSQALSNISDSKFVIGWLPASAFSSTFGNYAGYTRIWWTAKVSDAEMSFNAGEQMLKASLTNLQGIATHEFGHALGLEHSLDAGSIMYTPYHSVQYQLTLRKDDVNSVRELYPCEGCGDWTRVMNWAEQQYPTWFSALTKESQVIAPYQVRFYKNSNTYLGYNEVDSYFYGYNPALWGAQIVRFGRLTEYLPSAINAGY